MLLERKLGRTGIDVTALGLGCYQITEEFGVKQDMATQILDYAMDNGITWFHTAAMYGFGESEELVGRALVRHKDNPKLHCATQIGYFDKPVKEEYSNTIKQTWAPYFVDPDHMMRALKRSMWLLQKDVLDVIAIHEPDWPQWQIDAEKGTGVGIEFLEEVKKQGLAKNIGVGGWDYHGMAQLCDTGKIDFILCAGGMSLLTKDIYEEVVPACRRHNVGISLGGGFGQMTPYLVVKDRRWIELLKTVDDEKFHNVSKKVERLYNICDETGMSITELAIRYIMNHEDIHTHVAGAREVSHIQMNLASAEKGPLSQDLFNELEDIQNSSECPPIWDIRDVSRELAKKLK